MTEPKVERIVLVKLADEWATPEGRAELAKTSREILPTIPGVLSAEVGTPADAAAEASWDLALKVHFAHIDDVQPYIVHPIHKAYVETHLNPKSSCKKAWNFTK